MQGRGNVRTAAKDVFSSMFRYSFKYAGHLKVWVTTSAKKKCNFHETLQLVDCKKRTIQYEITEVIILIQFSYDTFCWLINRFSNHNLFGFSLLEQVQATLQISVCIRNDGCLKIIITTITFTPFDSSPSLFASKV